MFARDLSREGKRNFNSWACLRFGPGAPNELGPKPGLLNFGCDAKWHFQVLNVLRVCGFGAKSHAPAIDMRNIKCEGSGIYVPNVV